MFNIAISDKEVIKETSTSLLQTNRIPSTIRFTCSTNLHSTAGHKAANLFFNHADLTNTTDN